MLAITQACACTTCHTLETHRQPHTTPPTTQHRHAHLCEVKRVKLPFLSLLIGHHLDVHTPGGLVGEERRERERMRGREGRAGGGEGRGHTGVNKRKCSPDASATTTLHRAHHKHFNKQNTH